MMTVQESYAYMKNEIIEHDFTWHKNLMRNKGFKTREDLEFYYDNNDYVKVKKVFLEYFGWRRYINDVLANLNEDIMSNKELNNIEGHEDVYYFKDRLCYQIRFKNGIDYTVTAKDVGNNKLNAYHYFLNIFGYAEIRKGTLSFGYPSVGSHGMAGMDETLEEYKVKIVDEEPVFCRK